MTTRTNFQSLTTRVHSTEGSEQKNRENLGYRAEDLRNLGRYGYVLVGTVTAPEAEGVTAIIDTLMLVEQVDETR